MDERVGQVSAVLEEAERVHGVVSASRNGVDVDWPLFYAWWLLAWSRLPELLGATPSRSELAFELMQADRDFRAAALEETWSTFYARRLADRAWER